MADGRMCVFPAVSLRYIGATEEFHPDGNKSTKIRVQP